MCIRDRSFAGLLMVARVSAPDTTRCTVWRDFPSTSCASGEDSSLRIYVQPQRFTATWAGIVLFHELGHVLEHLAGVSSLTATGADWWNAEARAYHRGGRFPDPARSTAERWAPFRHLVFGAVIAMDAHPVSLADLSESSAGPELRRAATVWGWNAAEGSAHRPVASSSAPPDGRKSG